MPPQIKNNLNSEARQWRHYIRHNRARAKDKLTSSVLRNRRKQVLKYARAYARRRAPSQPPLAARHATPAPTTPQPTEPQSLPPQANVSENDIRKSLRIPIPIPAILPPSSTTRHQRPSLDPRHRPLRRPCRSPSHRPFRRLRRHRLPHSAARDADALHRRAEPSTHPRTEAHARSYDHDSDDGTWVWCSRVVFFFLRSLT